MGHRLILVIFGRGGVIWRVATCCKRVSTSSLTSNYVGPWHSSVTLLALCPLLSYAGAPSEACTVNAAYRSNSMCRSGSEINLCSRQKCHRNKKCHLRYFKCGDKWLHSTILFCFDIVVSLGLLWIYSHFLYYLIISSIRMSCFISIWPILYFSPSDLHCLVQLSPA